jgi:hypothetical protein
VPHQPTIPVRPVSMKTASGRRLCRNCRSSTCTILDDLARQNVLNRYIESTESEVPQCPQKGLGIRLRGAGPNVDVTRCTRRSMKSQSIGSHDNILDVVLVQCLEEVEEVDRSIARIYWSLGSSWGGNGLDSPARYSARASPAN